MKFVPAANDNDPPHTKRIVRLIEEIDHATLVAIENAIVPAEFSYLDVELGLSGSGEPSFL